VISWLKINRKNKRLSAINLMLTNTRKEAAIINLEETKIHTRK